MHVLQSLEAEQLYINFSSEPELIVEKYPKTLVAEAKGRALELEPFAVWFSIDIVVSEIITNLYWNDNVNKTANLELKNLWL